MRFSACALEIADRVGLDPSLANREIARALHSLGLGDAKASLEHAQAAAHDDERSTVRKRACAAWAHQLNGNWYPGETGAELSPEAMRAALSVVASPAADPLTQLLCGCVELGPSRVLGARSTLEGMLRAPGGEPYATSFSQDLLQELDRFRRLAEELQAPTCSLWAELAISDTFARVGRLAVGEQLLETTRASCRDRGDWLGAAATYLQEADWFLYPGSSSEALGVDLESRNLPSPFADRRDLKRAGAALDSADELLPVDADTTRGELQLRRAALAFEKGDFAGQLAALDQAQGYLAESGDAMRFLLFAHRQLAHMAQGSLAVVRPELSSAWGPPRATAAELVAWAETKGSATFCTGLGRLFERFGHLWHSQQRFDLAECAFSFAQPCLPVSGYVHEGEARQLLADLHARRGFHLPALAGRLQTLRSLPEVPDPIADSVEWLRQLHHLMPLANIPTGSLGTQPLGLKLMEHGVERLEQLFASATATDLQPAGSADELFADLVKTWKSEHAVPPMEQADAVTRKSLAVGITACREVIDRARPLMALLQAQTAQRRGWDVESGRWFRTAFEAVAKRDGWLRAIILNAWNKHDEARAEVEALTATMAPEMAGSLAVRSRDFELARDCFAQADAQSRPPPGDWATRLDRAEADLELGDLESAVALLSASAVFFERVLSSVRTDTERRFICDDVRVTALYLSSARVRVAQAERLHDAEERQSVYRAGLAQTERHYRLPLPTIDRPRSPNERALQAAATAQTTAYQRFLSGLVNDADPEELHALRQNLAHAEERLLDHEAASELPPAEQQPSLSVEAAQAALEPGACVLAYHHFNRNLVSWCVTRDTIDGRYRRLAAPLDGEAFRFVESCRRGDHAAEARTLANLLLAPFARTLSHHERVLIVPFGSLHTVPFHALPFGGRLFGLTHVVSNLPALSFLETGHDREVTFRRALVVADPKFDHSEHPELARLPGARLEGKHVRRLTGGTLLSGPSATEDESRRQLADCSLIHFAAHGRVDEVAPNTSALVLAGSDRLTVSDLIGLRLSADLAVLSACDTGRGVVSLGGDVVGLVRGLLAAGVRRSVVSLWPVDDVAACVTMVEFYRRLASEPPAWALAGAQREVHKLDGAELLERYRELGGDAYTGRASRRRQSRLAPFPEVDDDDHEGAELADAKSGNPSLWAPFVLIGA